MSNASPIQPRLLSKLNEKLVLETIQSRGPSTRAELTEQIGVTFPTVAKAVTSLLNSAFLEEFDEVSWGPGRPAKRLRLSVETAQVIGIALEADKVTLVAASLDGVQRGDVLEFAVPSTYEALLAEIGVLLKGLTASAATTTLGLGVSVPGLVDSERQRVLFSANLPILNGKSLSKDLREAYGIDAVIANDVNAMCLAEHLRGNAKDARNFAVLDHVFGISLGLMDNGRLVYGQQGFAGELGHVPIQPNGAQCVCGNRGCLETLASEWAMAARLGEKLGRSLTIEEALELVQQNEPAARAEARRACKSLAIGVAQTVNLFNPQRVVLFSRLLKAQPELLDLLLANTKRLCLAPSFEACDFVQAVTNYLDGAIAGVLSHLTKSRVPSFEGAWGEAVSGARVDPPHPLPGPPATP